MDDDREPEVTSHDRVPPEQRDLDVKCYTCGTVAPVSEMGITFDGVAETEEGAITSVTRRYICGDDCSEVRYKASKGDSDEVEA